MERSSSRRDLRVQRLDRSSPYARPKTQSKKSTASASHLSSPHQPFVTIKSIYSYFTSPFARSESESTLPIHFVDVDQNSESGSEDGWNGDAPALMEGQDVIDLAAAAGRDGQEFEGRAAEWRARGEKAGGRRDTVRRNLEGTTSSSALKSPTMPGHMIGLKASPSLPAVTLHNTLKRNLSPPRLPARSPLPSFLPPSTRPAPSISSVASQSASSAALAAFLEAKKGQQITVEDFRVIETLTANMKSESVAGSPRRADVRTGGWSAGVFSETPRAIRPVRGANGYDSTNTTPAKPTNTFGTPGAAFSLGMDTPLAGPSSANRHRITYLGPGMSPRRMIPKPQSGRKPLFSLNLSEDESAPKKRRVEEGGLEIDGDANHQRSRVNGLSSSVSMPNFATFDQRKSTAMDSEKDNTSKTPGRPSPLSYQNGVNGRQDADAIGKKRAADIMKELIDEEMGPEEAARQPEYIMINPYDTESAASSSVPTPSTPRSPMRSAIPQKSILRSSLRGKETPKRGAAAKLEGHKSRRKLTTLEILQGKRPWTETSTPNHKQNETPSKSPQSETWTREDDEMEIDAYFDKTPSRTPAPPSRPAGRSPSTSPVPAPAPSSSKIPSPEPFAPFVVPTLTSSNLPIPSFQPTTSSQSFPSPSQDSALAPAQKKVQPKFNPSPLSSSITPIDIDEPELPRRAPASTTKTPTDANAIYLSAKDSALKIAKPALPFFTFTLTAPTSSPSDPVRSKALERPTEIFKFTLPAVDATPTTSKFVFGAPKPQEEAEWTCSMCMLKNPGSAKEKCLICEEKRP